MEQAEKRKRKSIYIPKQAEELVFTFAEHAIFDPEKTAPIVNSGPVFSGSNLAGSASAKSQFFSLFGYTLTSSLADYPEKWFTSGSMNGRIFSRRLP